MRGTFAAFKGIGLREVSKERVMTRIVASWRLLVDKIEEIPQENLEQFEEEIGDINV